ncbi:3-deoxy-D-manno-octulosonic-acid transferase [Mariprofundus micogutta]|uniref:3-deoxy-D-manno-octulosonic acid transferase n=2 Tax=Mariprofundus micogutta TaxID=1921010 RepID=A0A1L8CPN7_9PROT|nr:3-deoxy-D-manno-octulosonic-acid transferase [Mariprofundus micogutta]
MHLTVVTATGFAHAKRLLGSDISISYLPWDIPGTMARLVNKLRPALLLLAETEFWPGMLLACNKRNIPVIGINTRISDRSFPRYQATRFFWSRCLKPVAMFLAQSAIDAERLVGMGVSADRVRVVGNLKYAVSAPTVDAGALRLKIDSSCNRPILLIASTHEGEDRAILNMWPVWHAVCPDLLTIIVPRHPERFDQVANLIREHGHGLSRWSQHEQHDSDFILVDAMGILGELYSVADAVIIAGSLKNIGGHNPLEAAVCGRGVVTGPFVQNFREIMDHMQQDNAAIIAADNQELELAISRLLQHPDELKQLHAHAALFIQNKAAVLESTLEFISAYLPDSNTSDV